MQMLKLEHIEKAYQQGKNTVPVLHDITFHFAHGEFVAIMGPSGSGKSTLMNLIGLLDTPTSGSFRKYALANPQRKNRICLSEL